MSKIIPLVEAHVVMAIGALRYVARSEAGQSQKPDLFSAEDTEEWELAERLQRRLDKSRRKVRHVGGVARP